MVYDDSTLVRRAIEGDERAFEEIVRRYERTIYNVAYRMVKSHDDAMDIAQTVFIKAYKNLTSFKPEYKLFSWLYRITVNETINYIKRERRTVSLDCDLVSDRRNPGDDLLRLELGERIQNALMELKLDHRIVVVLKYFLELSYSEISEIVGIPEKTVKSRLFTAREKLRDVLVRQGLSR
jgi:RNA polymerase sigma-70 factor (ECF subfamily)